MRDENFARGWITANLKSRPVGGNRVCEAFSWRVVDLLEDDGCVGLLVHATSTRERKLSYPYHRLSMR